MTQQYYQEDNEGRGQPIAEGTALIAGVNILAGTVSHVGPGTHQSIFDNINTPPVVDLDLGRDFAQAHFVSEPISTSATVIYNTSTPDIRPVVEYAFRCESIGGITASGGASRGCVISVTGPGGDRFDVFFAGGAIQLLTSAPGQGHKWLDSSGNLTTNYLNADTNRWVAGQTYFVRVTWLTDTTYDLYVAPFGSPLVKQNTVPIDIFAGTGIFDSFQIGNLRLDHPTDPQVRLGDVALGFLPVVSLEGGDPYDVR